MLPSFSVANISSEVSGIAQLWQIFCSIYCSLFNIFIISFSANMHLLFFYKCYNVVMLNEKDPNNKFDEGEIEETASLKRQQDKLVGFYLSGGDRRYVFNSGPGKERFSEKRVTQVDRDKVSDMMFHNKIPLSIEHDLLDHVAGPADYEDVGVDGVFRNLEFDGVQRQILGYMTGVPWDDYEHTSGQNVHDFLQNYPTPMEFAKTSRDFLVSLARVNKDEVVRDYADAMETFKYTMYGKKYEYYLAMKKMHRESKDMVSKETRDSSWGANVASDDYNRERLVVSAGIAEKSSGQVAGNGNKESEDSAYYNPEAGIFAVFDGAGGMMGGQQASLTARDVFARIAERNDLESANSIGNALLAANSAILRDSSAGHSTAVVGRVIMDEKDNTSKLIYASVGDSRIYVVRNGKAKLITKDEGYRNIITNSLGSQYCRIKQKGYYPLEEGDRIVFCSDGVTGDVEEDFIPIDEFASIVTRAKDAQSAAQGLVDRATKIDDRTAIVAEV